MRVLPNVGSFGPAAPEEILRPAKPWFVLSSLLVGLLLNLVPVSGVVLAYRPDFLALVLLYWCIQEPRYVGVATAWIVGLLMDVGDATVFGQHAADRPRDDDHGERLDAVRAPSIRRDHAHDIVVSCRWSVVRK